MRQFYDLVASRKSYELGDGGKGIILTLIKSNEVLKENTYKKIAENVLSKYPQHVVNTNFTLQNGLAGIGEVYLEAWRVFKNEEWKSRADWIANVYLNTFFKNEDGSGYWKLEENNPPTADLRNGIGGIVHFISRCLYPDKIGHHMLK
jgi:lantibiotic modifying enzyme